MIQLSSVSKVYKQRGSKVVALGGVNLQVGEGQTVAIVGESGSGKTTLARILLGLVEPTTGTYTYKGQDVSKLHHGPKRRWRKEVQAVFQNPLSALNPRLRVEVLVTEPAEADRAFRRGERRALAVECLRMVGLPDQLVDRYPHQLSGGQRQRVAIARALSSNPRVLILDEPVSALDVSVRSQILNLLRRLQRERQLTFIYVTHDLATVEFLCDSAYVLYRGLVFEGGPAEEVLRSPKNPYTELLIESIPTIDKHLSPRLLTGPEENSTPSDGQGGCLFADRCSYVETICRSTAPVLRSEGPSLRSSRCHFQLDLVVGASDRELSL